MQGLLESNPLKNYLHILLKQAKADLERRFQRAKIGITPFQYAILLTLRPAPLTLNDLARQMKVRPPSLVPPVDDLEKATFLKREKDLKDRRKIHLIVTNKSRQLLDKVPLDDARDSVNSAAAQLTPVKRKQLVALLQELVENLPHK